MKKYLLFAAALLMLAGCQKSAQEDNSQKPTVAWNANENFGEMEIASDMDAKVVLTVPEGVSSFSVTVSRLPVELIGVANKLISSSANKGSGTKSPVFDLIADGTCVSNLTRIGFLTGNPKTATTCTLDFGKLLWELAGDSPLENASKFVFDIALKDKKDNMLSRSVRFNWTSAPVISVASGNTFPYSLKRGTTESLVLKVDAPGKIASFVMGFEGEADKGIQDFIMRRNGTSSTVIDLIGSDNASSAFGLPAVSAIKDKTSVEVNLTTLMQNFSYENSTSGKSYSFKISVADALGKSADYTFAISIPVAF